MDSVEMSTLLVAKFQVSGIWRDVARESRIVSLNFGSESEVSFVGVEDGLELEK